VPMLIKIITLSLLAAMPCYAQDMVFVKYEVVEDCKWVSTVEKVYDKDGNYVGVIVKQDSRCD